MLEDLATAHLDASLTFLTARPVRDHVNCGYVARLAAFERSSQSVET